MHRLAIQFFGLDDEPDDKAVGDGDSRGLRGGEDACKDTAEHEDRHADSGERLPERGRKGSLLEDFCSRLTLVPPHLVQARRDEGGSCS